MWQRKNSNKRQKGKLMPHDRFEYLQDLTEAELLQEYEKAEREDDIALALAIIYVCDDQDEDEWL
jgi:hypothetical protein